MNQLVQIGTTVLQDWLKLDVDSLQVERFLLELLPVAKLSEHYAIQLLCSCQVLSRLCWLDQTFGLMRAV